MFLNNVCLTGLGNYLFLARVQMLLCIMANIGSVYLGYILYFVLEDICVVCVSTYFVNFVLLIVNLFRISKLKQLNLETGGPILQTGGFNKTKKRVQGILQSQSCWILKSQIGCVKQFGYGLVWGIIMGNVLFLVLIVQVLFVIPQL